MTDERLKIWLDFTKFVTGTLILGVVSTIINNKIQTRQVEIQETKQLGAFLEQALAENIGTRRQFAEYFATVTRSKDMRELWKKYQEIIETDKARIEREIEAGKKKVREAAAKLNEQGDNEEARLLLRETVSELEEKTNELTVRGISPTTVTTGLCKIEGDARLIEVVGSDRGCTVYYTKNDVRTRQGQFRERENCTQVANNIVQNLQSANFSCNVDWN